MKRYYVKKQIKRACIFSVAINNAGTNEEDYNKGKWVEISEEQAMFYNANPNASFQEIISMEMSEVKENVIPVEIRYRNRVEQLMREKYSIGSEIRILFNGENDSAWKEHEQDALKAKLQAKKELGIE
jgi:hypothetical protein